MTAPRKPTRVQRDSHLIRTKINFAQLPMILILKGRKPPRHILAIDPGNAMYRTDRKLEPASPVIITDHRNMLKPLMCHGKTRAAGTVHLMKRYPHLIIAPFKDFFQEIRRRRFLRDRSVFFYLRITSGDRQNKLIIDIFYQLAKRFLPGFFAHSQTGQIKDCVTRRMRSYILSARVPASVKVYCSVRYP